MSTLSLTVSVTQTKPVSPSPSHTSVHLSLTLFSHSVKHSSLRRSPSLTHPLLLLRQTFITSPMTHFTNHPLSLTLFSHSVKHSLLRRSPSSLTQSIWHSSSSTKDLIKHSEVYRGLIKSPLSLTELWAPQSTPFLKTKIKGELLQSVFHFHRLVVGKQWEKSKKLWFQFIFFYFGFCFEFLIELLKNIEALLFFEIELCLWVSGFVYICCGIGLCFLVCLYLLRI